MKYRVRIIREVPGQSLRVGDEIESLTAWWLVDLGYAVPLNFEWQVDPVKAARARKKLEDWYDSVTRGNRTIAVKTISRR